MKYLYKCPRCGNKDGTYNKEEDGQVSFFCHRCGEMTFIPLDKSPFIVDIIGDLKSDIRRLLWLFGICIAVIIVDILVMILG